MVRAAFSKLLLNYKSSNLDGINKSDQTKIINKFNDNNKHLLFHFLILLNLIGYLEKSYMQMLSKMQIIKIQQI